MLALLLLLLLVNGSPQHTLHVIGGKISISSSREQQLERLQQEQKHVTEAPDNQPPSLALASINNANLHDNAPAFRTSFSPAPTSSAGSTGAPFKIPFAAKGKRSGRRVTKESAVVVIAIKHSPTASRIFSPPSPLLIAPRAS